MRLFQLCLMLCVVGLIWTAGCAEEDYPAMSADVEAEYAYAEAGEARATADSTAIIDSSGSTALPTDLDQQQGRPDAPSAAEGRKIIYNANIDLVVDDFDKVPADVAALAKKHGGFIASSSIRGSEGEPRVGNWTLRIPSARFDDFVNGAQSIGQVRELTSDSKEVTAEYVDLESRVRNLQAEEARLHKHLDQNTRSLKEILEVEREIARVRGQVEMYQGRLNVLKDLTALSTVTLTIEEIKDYVPEATEEPGYTTQVARTWAGSIDAVGGFLSAVSLGLVGLTPWLVVIVPVGTVLWLVLRRLRVHTRRAEAATAQQPG